MQDEHRPRGALDLDALQHYAATTVTGPPPCTADDLLALVAAARRVQLLEGLVVALMRHIPSSVTVALHEAHVQVLDQLWPAPQALGPVVPGGPFDVVGGNGERIRIADTGAQL